MSTPKKVSQLGSTTIDGSEKFHVAKGGNDYAVSISDVASFIGSGGGATEVWDLATFQANANTILPLGKKAYYKKGNGKVTGIYKIGDGVTTVANLPIQYELFNYADYPSNNFPSLLPNWQHDLINKFIATNTSDGSAASTSFDANLRYHSVLIPFPFQVTGYAINVFTFTSAGSINVALYSVGSNGSGTLVSGSYGVINVTGVGIQSVSISPITLEPGLYYIVFNQPSGVFNVIGYNASSSIYKQGWIFMPDGTKKSYSAVTFTGTFPPATVNAINGYNSFVYYFRINYNNII